MRLDVKLFFVKCMQVLPEDNAGTDNDVQSLLPCVGVAVISYAIMCCTPKHSVTVPLRLGLIPHVQMISVLGEDRHDI